ncbi:MAG: anti-sigma factor family protein [Acidobacteriota bacterium]|jgi:anti-sigma factor RsiW
MNTEHGITEKQWMAYLDGSLPESACARIRSHLAVCAECRSMRDQLLAWESAVVQEINRLNAAATRSSGEIDLLAGKFLQRLRENETRPTKRAPFKPVEAVRLMQALLDPLCGAGAARNAVQQANEQSCRAGEADVSVPNWSLFVRNLSKNVGCVYGSPARLLIERVGSLVGTEIH